MKLYLTNGFHGNKLEYLINNDISDIQYILEFIYKWKTTPANKTKYRLEPYDRFIFHEDYVIIDVGDYYTFIEIGDMTKADIDNLKTKLNMEFGND